MGVELFAFRRKRPFRMEQEREEVERAVPPELSHLEALSWPEPASVEAAASGQGTTAPGPGSSAWALEQLRLLGAARQELDVVIDLLGKLDRKDGLATTHVSRSDRRHVGAGELAIASRTKHAELTRAAGLVLQCADFMEAERVASERMLAEICRRDKSFYIFYNLPACNHNIKSAPLTYHCRLRGIERPSTN